MQLVSPQIMKKWDSLTIQAGVDELILIENSSRAAFNLLEKKFSLVDKTIFCFMGAGNNGADSLCLARHLNDAGANVHIVHTRLLKSYPKHIQKLIKIAKNEKLSFIAAKQFLKKNISADIIVDGIFGTGFSGKIADLETKLIHKIIEYKKNAYILALDVPSGVNALTGEAELAVQAHATLCFEALKPGLIIDRARAYTGKIYVKKIGILKSVKQSCPSDFEFLENQIFYKNKPEHKGQAGHILVLGSSSGLLGAAKLAGLAALKQGAGLVSLALPSALKANISELMEIELVGNPKFTDKDSLEVIKSKIPNFSSVILGVGLGQNEQSLDFIAEYLSIKNRPATIFDADALNLLAKKTELLQKLSVNDIISPHPKEAARLLNTSVENVQINRLEALQKLNKICPAVCILKGVNTLIGQEHTPICISPANVPNLAVGGSGDVLAGILASLLAQNFPLYSSFTIAKQAVYNHILAGLYLQKKYKNRGNLASDIAKAIPFIYKVDYLKAMQIKK